MTSNSSGFFATTGCTGGVDLALTVMLGAGVILERKLAVFTTEEVGGFGPWKLLAWIGVGVGAP